MWASGCSSSATRTSATTRAASAPGSTRACRSRADGRDRGRTGKHLGRAHANGAAASRGRARARGLLDRHAGAARDLARVRRQRDDGRLGADLVQLRARARRPCPAAYLARRRPQGWRSSWGRSSSRPSSLLCGIATNFDLLVGARCIQAVGAALVVTASLPLLLAETTGSQSSAPPVAPVGHGRRPRGAALGPAAGGVLTQALGWQSIFLAQVPLALVTLVRRARARPVRPSQTQAERDRRY